MLGGTVDEAAIGSPSVVFHEQCTGNYMPGYGVGMNPDPYPYQPSNQTTRFIGTNPNQIQGGVLQAGAIASTGPSLFRPRMARNSDGFILPDNPGGYPRTWTTFLYYTPGDINGNGSSCGDNYKQIWKTQTQNFGVSQVIIKEL